MMDMFGIEAPPISDAERKRRKRRLAGRPLGYAALPGTGPEGETCKTCAHLYRNRMAKTYLKCGLMRAVWTGGGATDVLARSPACRRWEPSTPQEG
jgi:hypothetical protein